MADDGRQSLWTGVQRTANDEDIEDIEIALRDNLIWTSSGRDELGAVLGKGLWDSLGRRYMTDEEDELDIYEAGPLSATQDQTTGE
jgi:hypothetical protein